MPVALLLAGALSLPCCQFQPSPLEDPRNQNFIQNLEARYFEPARQTIEQLDPEAPDYEADREIQIDLLVAKLAEERRRWRSPTQPHSAKVDWALVEAYGFLSAEQFEQQVAESASVQEVYRRINLRQHARREATRQLRQQRRETEKANKDEQRAREQAARVAWSHKLLQETGVDREQPLAYLGFDRSKLLFVDGNIELHLVFYPSSNPNDEAWIVHAVAVHDVADDAPIFSVDSEHNWFNGGIESARLSTETRRRLESIAKRVSVAAPTFLIDPTGAPSDQLFLLHYTKSRDLLHQKEPSGTRRTVKSPLVLTSYQAQRDGETTEWGVRTTETESGPSDIIGGPARGLSLKSTNAARRLYNYAVEKWGRWTNDGQQLERELEWAEYDKRVGAEYASKGLIYRPHLYWDQYKFGVLLRPVLHGTLRVDATPERFRMIYLIFIERYFAYCDDCLPKDAVGTKKENTLAAELAAFLIPQATLDADELRMKAKLWLLYETVSTVQGNGDLPLISGLFKMNSKELVEEVQYLGEMYLDINRMILLEGCKSGFLAQFEENLYRLGTKLPPLQDLDRVHPFHGMDTR